MNVPLPTYITIHSTEGKDRPDAFDVEGLDAYMASQSTHYDKVCELKDKPWLYDMWPVTEIGAQARGWNGTSTSLGRSIGYAFIGDGRVTVPTDAELLWVARFVHADMKAWNISIDHVLMHKDMPGASTDCPGSAFAEQFHRFIEMINLVGA